MFNPLSKPESHIGLKVIKSRWRPEPWVWPEARGHVMLCKRSEPGQNTEIINTAFTDLLPPSSGSCSVASMPLSVSTSSCISGGTSAAVSSSVNVSHSLYVLSEPRYALSVTSFCCRKQIIMFRAETQRGLKPNRERFTLFKLKNPSNPSSDLQIGSKVN